MLRHQTSTTPQQGGFLMLTATGSLSDKLRDLGRYKAKQFVESHLLIVVEVCGPLQSEHHKPAKDGTLQGPRNVRMLQWLV